MAIASSRNGTGVLSPYTEEEEPKTNRDTPARLAASATAAVPVTLARAYPTGSASDGRTPAFAARCTTTVSGVSRARARRHRACPARGR